MDFGSNLFTYPEKLGEAEKYMDALQYQIKMVEALERTRQRLSNTTVLSSRTLDHCLTFMQYVNTTINFSNEVAKLSLNELRFAAISFEGRRLKSLLNLFKASDVKKYVDMQNINCLHRSEISTRINYYLLKLDGNRFANIYSNAKTLSGSDMVLYEGRIKLESSLN